MSVELDTGLPSTRLIQALLRDKKPLEVKLTTGDTFSGVLRWQDPLCMYLDVEGQTVMLWRSAIAYIKPS